MVHPVNVSRGANELERHRAWYGWNARIPGSAEILVVLVWATHGPVFQQPVGKFGRMCPQFIYGFEIRFINGVSEQKGRFPPSSVYACVFFNCIRVPQRFSAIVCDGSTRKHVTHKTPVWWERSTMMFPNPLKMFMDPTKVVGRMRPNDRTRKIGR